MKTGQPRNRVTRLMVDPFTIKENSKPLFHWDILGTITLDSTSAKKKIIILWWLEFKLENNTESSVIFGHETQIDILSVTTLEEDSPIVEYLIQNSYISTEAAFRSHFKDFPFERPAERFRILSLQLMENLVHSGEY